MPEKFMFCETCGGFWEDLPDDFVVDIEDIIFEPCPFHSTIDLEDDSLLANEMV